jgi:hypothetical protein
MPKGDRVRDEPSLHTPPVARHAPLGYWNPRGGQRFRPWPDWVDPILIAGCLVVAALLVTFGVACLERLAD